jgi:hypothetical protein
VGKTEEKIVFIRLRCKWENNIEMELNTRGWEGVNWINLFLLSQDRDKRGSGVKEVMRLMGAGVKRSNAT